MKNNRELRAALAFLRPDSDVSDDVIERVLNNVREITVPLAEELQVDDDIEEEGVFLEQLDQLLDVCSHGADLPSYLDGSCAPEVHDRLTRHLTDGCEPCAAMLALLLGAEDASFGEDESLEPEESLPLPASVDMHDCSTPMDLSVTRPGHFIRNLIIAASFGLCAIVAVIVIDLSSDSSEGHTNRTGPDLPVADIPEPSYADYKGRFMPRPGARVQTPSTSNVRVERCELSIRGTSGQRLPFWMAGYKASEELQKTNSAKSAKPLFFRTLRSLQRRRSTIIGFSDPRDTETTPVRWIFLEPGQLTASVHLRCSLSVRNPKSVFGSSAEASIEQELSWRGHFSMLRIKKKDLRPLWHTFLLSVLGDSTFGPIVESKKILLSADSNRENPTATLYYGELVDQRPVKYLLSKTATSLGRGGDISWRRGATWTVKIRDLTPDNKGRRPGRAKVLAMFKVVLYVVNW